MAKPTKIPDLYRDDIAHIHVDGYTFHCKQAAECILGWLEEFAIPAGKVVDLGCGGGQWLAELNRAGYQTCGIDVSPKMIAIAKENVPQSEYICGSFDSVDIPACDAATSVGEPLNYLASGPKMRRTMRKVFRALRPGGVFIFDVRHPPSRPVPTRHHQKLTDDWLCYSRVEENHETGDLIRYITTFRRTDDGMYRRDDEVHRLKVFSRSEMSAWLREIGFRVRNYRDYGSFQLGAGQSVFVCRKP